MLKVSAIVPVYNPGRDIDDCIRSLLAQSLPRDEYELIFVDDGSTDGTGARLDELAAEHSNVRVERIPNSGWPGRPRNVGLDMARAPYVYFVDNDDWLGEEAFERLHARAEADDADIVIGKVVGHGKYVPRALFREHRSGVTLEWQPLLGLLTPAKLFRRAMLDEHGIRFPEGRRRLEDHVFVVHAYFHARGISVLADYPCYHWVLRREGDDANASYRPFEPAAYYGYVREVLDLVEEHTQPGPDRDRLLSHWYRGKMLGRVGGRYFARRDPSYRRELYEEIRKLALERYGPEVEEWLAPSLRVRSALLRGGDLAALEALAQFEAGLSADVRVRERRRDGGELILELDARLSGGLRFDGGRWRPPAGVPDPALLLDLDSATAQILVRSLDDGAEYVLGSTATARLEDTGEVVLSGEARVRPSPPGRWELLGAVNVAGFSAVGRARDAASAAPLRLRTDGADVVVERALPSLAGRLARRMPRLARAARRVAS